MCLERDKHYLTLNRPSDAKPSPSTDIQADTGGHVALEEPSRQDVNGKGPTAKPLP